MSVRIGWHKVGISPALVGIGFLVAGLAHALPASASAQPKCVATRVVREGVLKQIHTAENGDYTSFKSRGGGTYGVDPNSIPEELMNALKPNGPSLTATITGRVCEDRIFYIENVIAPFHTPVRPYTP